LYTKIRKFLAVNVKHLRDFFTLCGAPMAGDSYWLSKRRYAKYLQILNPKEASARYFLNIKSVPPWKNLKTTHNYILGLDLRVMSERV